ncbi:hypothetical protein [Cryobacterium breve]|uniref:hypothetical protein n=1 Tax=Cryobacterium breve TaxID=1259258 RepID=UPI00248C5F69|nr:hypothetical protein [Cryobacterium breve]
MVTLPTGTLTNPAFGVGSAGTWATVAGSGGTASFRYEVDNSAYSSSGTLRIRATGRVGSQTRSIVANLKQQGFIDFLYFTDYEIQDPDQSGASVTQCVKYGWAGRPLPGSGTSCSDIAFGNGDVINGPVHSNDRIRICDATFSGMVTTANPGTGLLYLKQDSNGNSCTGQSIPLGVTYSPVVGMPSTNSQMKKETRTDLTTDVPLPGCLYTGPTSIVFNSAGTMTVRSPWSKFTNVIGDPATSGVNIPAKCGTVGTAAGSLGSAGGATIPVLVNNLVYVQNVPSGTSDPNGWPTSGSGSYPSTYASNTCASGNGIGYPMANESVASIPTSYGCRNGDIFVKGTLQGAMTIASENFVYVTGDITYSNASTDILGIVGQNAVWVWNPVNGSNVDLLPNDRQINAAILSVSHTFQVQNYDRGGSQGTLTVNGAIAQKFRGIVRSGSNGYIKAYSYDQRFKYVAPPKFLSPVATTYGVSVLVEVKSAFTTGGVAIP